MRYTLLFLGNPAPVTVQDVDGPRIILQPPQVVRPASFRALIHTEGHVELWDDTEGTADDSAIFYSCPGLRDARAAIIRRVGNERLEALANPYMSNERLTWPIQQQEAEAWRSDPTALTPMLDAIAANRGTTKPELVELVMGNVELFRTMSGQILGQQQALLDRIYSVQTVDELLAVAWP